MVAVSAEEFARYQRDGVLIPDCRIPAARLAELDEVLANNPKRRPEQLVSAHIAGPNKEGVRGHAAFLTYHRKE